MMIERHPLIRRQRQLGPLHVLDLGARIIDGHPPTYQPLVEAGICHLTAFEAAEDAADELRRQGDFSDRVLCHAVGDGTPRDFFVCRLKSRSSLFRPDWDFCNIFNAFADGSEVEQVYTVNTVRLDDIPDIGRVDFVKLDIQGAEKMALLGGKRTLASVLAAEIEVEFVPQYQNQPLFGDVDIVARGFGWMFHTFRGYGTRTLRPLVVNADPTAGINQWLWADAVYMADVRYYSKMHDDALIRLALLMDVLYGSWDVAYQALHTVDQRSGSGLAEEYMSWLQETV